MKQFTNGFVGGLATLDLQRDQTSSNMDGGEVGKGKGGAGWQLPQLDRW